LGLADGRIDSKVLLADAVIDGEFSVIYAISQGADPVKTMVYISEMTSIPSMLAEVQVGLAKEKPSGEVHATDYSVVSFISTHSPEKIYTAASTTFVVVDANNCSRSFTTLMLLGVEAPLNKGGDQHAAAVNMMAQNAVPAVPPGTILPSGTPLPAALPSPYADCVAALGPRPSAVGLQDPCDLLIANALVCDWDSRCATMRAEALAKRKLKTAAVGWGFTGAGLLAGFGTIACPPCGVVAIAVAGCLATVGVLGGSYAVIDSVGDAVDASRDATAARNETQKCWAQFDTNFQQLCFP